MKHVSTVLEAHFGAANLDRLLTSRRQFAAQLAPDLQVAVMAELAPFEAVLHGVHQSSWRERLTIAGLLSGKEPIVKIVPKGAKFQSPVLSKTCFGS